MDVISVERQIAASGYFKCICRGGNVLFPRAKTVLFPHTEVGVLVGPLDYPIPMNFLIANYQPASFFSNREPEEIGYLSLGFNQFETGDSEFNSSFLLQSGNREVAQKIMDSNLVTAFKDLGLINFSLVSTFSSNLYYYSYFDENSNPTKYIRRYWEIVVPCEVVKQNQISKYLELADLIKESLKEHFPDAKDYNSSIYYSYYKGNFAHPKLQILNHLWGPTIVALSIFFIFIALTLVIGLMQQ